MDNNKKVLRNLLIYMGIPIVIFFILMFFMNGSDAEKVGLKYSDVIGYFEDGKVRAYELDLGTGEMEFVVTDDAGKETKYAYIVPNVNLFYNSVADDIEAYNAAAVEIVTRHGMAVNDLYTLSKSLPKSAHSDETHYYTKEGTQAFTDRVLEQVAGVIGVKAEPLDYDALFTEVKEVHGV